MSGGRDRRSGAAALAAVVDALYDCALEPEAWPRALDGIVALLGGHGGVIYTPTVAADDGGVWVGRNIADGSMQAYMQHFRHVDLWTGAAMAITARDPAAGQRTWTSRDLVDAASFDRSEWWNDFLREMDFYHLCSAWPIVGPRGDPVVNLSVYRPRTAPHYSRSDVVLFDRIRPHLQRAFEIHRRLRWGSARGLAALAALEALRIAVFLVDARGRVGHENRAARALLAANDGVAVRNGTLAGLDGDLGRPVARAIGRDGGGAARGAVTLPMRRRSGRAPYIATVVPVAGAGRIAALPGVAAVVFVSDPAARPRLLPPALARALGITPAEARLVNLLLEVDSLAAAAAVLGISPNTARSQLNSVLARTGTSRQAELVAMLLQASAHLIED